MTRILMITLRGNADDGRELSAGLDANTHVTLRTAEAAPGTLLSAHDWTLADLAVLAAGQKAESEGFDAVCVGEVGDYGVGALRSVVSIPVIGAGRSAMLHALTLGNRFAMLAPYSRYSRAKKLVGDYALDRQCAAVRSFAAEAEDRVVMPQILAEARSCVDEDGADVLCLDTDDHTIAPQLAAELGVPVVAPAPLCLKLAESFLGLHLSHSRGAYPAPQVRKEALIAAITSSR